MIVHCVVKVALPESENLYEGLTGRLLIPAGTRVMLQYALATSGIPNP